MNLMEENFQCSSCRKTVPVGNRTMHSLVCGRHKSRLKETQPIEEVAHVASTVEEVVPVVPETLLDTNEVDTRVSSGNEHADALNAAWEEESAAVSAVNGVRGNDAMAGATAANNHMESILVECEYCDLPVAMIQLENHSLDCGSRTDVCEVCLHYVRLRDMKRHRDSNCSIASTGSAMRAADADETEPLISNRSRHQTTMASREQEESAWATPVAYAVGAAAAAAAMSLLMRRR